MLRGAAVETQAEPSLLQKKKLWENRQVGGKIIHNNVTLCEKIIWGHRRQESTWLASRGAWNHRREVPSLQQTILCVFAVKSCCRVTDGDENVSEFDHHDMFPMKMSYFDQEDLSVVKKYKKIPVLCCWWSLPCNICYGACHDEQKEEEFGEYDLIMSILM